jgi:hypothetical protein
MGTSIHVNIWFRRWEKPTLLASIRGIFGNKKRKEGGLENIIDVVNTLIKKKEGGLENVIDVVNTPDPKK